LQAVALYLDACRKPAQRALCTHLAGTAQAGSAARISPEQLRRDAGWSPAASRTQLALRAGSRSRGRRRLRWGGAGVGCSRGRWLGRSGRRRRSGVGLGCSRRRWPGRSRRRRRSGVGPVRGDAPLCIGERHLAIADRDVQRVLDVVLGARTEPTRPRLWPQIFEAGRTAEIERYESVDLVLASILRPDVILRDDRVLYPSRESSDSLRVAGPADRLLNVILGDTRIAGAGRQRGIGQRGQSLPLRRGRTLVRCNGRGTTDRRNRNRDRDQHERSSQPTHCACRALPIHCPSRPHDMLICPPLSDCGFEFGRGSCGDTGV
jgi:hypothetical protein